MRTEKRFKSNGRGRLVMSIRQWTMTRIAPCLEMRPRSPGLLLKVLSTRAECSTPFAATCKLIGQLACCLTLVLRYGVLSLQSRRFQESLGLNLHSARLNPVNPEIKNPRDPLKTLRLVPGRLETGSFNLTPSKCSL